jgi:hypothetical protein
MGSSVRVPEGSSPTREVNLKRFTGRIVVPKRGSGMSGYALISTWPNGHTDRLV